MTKVAKIGMDHFWDILAKMVFFFCSTKKSIFFHSKKVNIHLCNSDTWRLYFFLILLILCTKLLLSYFAIILLICNCKWRSFYVQLELTTCLGMLMVKSFFDDNSALIFKDSFCHIIFQYFDHSVSMWENVFNDLVSSVVVLTVIKTIDAVVIVIVVVVVAWQKVEEYIFFQTIKLVCFFHPNLQPINFTFIAFFWSHDSLISSPSAFLSTLIYLL